MEGHSGCSATESRWALERGAGGTARPSKYVFVALYLHACVLHIIYRSVYVNRYIVSYLCYVRMHVKVDMGVYIQCMC